MPLVNSAYTPPFYLFNGHLQTIVPAILYTGKNMSYQRERIETKDGDFLDIDWLQNGNKRLAIISHGLEGSSSAPYTLRMAGALSANGWDVLCWNFRGCSGVPNRNPTFYHSGFTTDLDDVLHYAAKTNRYDSILLIGFSIGGNITLKYLGEQGGGLLPAVKKAVVFSVPCDLESGAQQLAKRVSVLYMKRFLTSFKKKFTEKNKLFPGYFNLNHFSDIHNFFQFDSIYTAPMFGFKDVHDYYSKASSKPYLPEIKVPTLMVNALNDPFLGSGCFPFDIARESSTLCLETPLKGGHAGFPAYKGYWPGKRVMEFWGE
jgi:hypothetical protein